MTDSSGLVSRRFRLGELLGTGGSASVFAAVDTSTGASVALKLLHPHLSGRPATREAFFAEARRARELRHPNIAGVLDVGVDTHGVDPVAWIALERAGGSSLAEHVERRGPLGVPEALAVLDGMLRALEAAHAVGLVHRDVSPANVMVAVSDAGSIATAGVRLLDFGLADAAGRAALGSDVLRSEPDSDRAGVIGNVNYMSPEQVRGAAVDERGDVYQAGAVLYFALTGRPPFGRATVNETMRAHLDLPPPVPSVMDSRIPRDVDRLVVRALLKAPSDRFASAGEMRAALDVAGRGAAQPRVETRARGLDTPASPATRPAGAPATGVTRVLGSTSVPDRSPAAERTAVQRAGKGRRPLSRHRHRRRMVSAWMTGAGVAAVVATLAGFAAAGSPVLPVPTASSPPSQVAPLPSPADDAAPSSAPVQPDPVVEAVEVVVPLVAFSSLAEAMRALADAGLEAGELTVVDSAHAADTVLDSSPAAGTPVAVGASVSLTVASGFNRVPRVAGLTRTEALGALQGAGFTVALATISTDVLPGTIVGSDPAEGTALALGTTVTVLESDGPAPASLPPAATATPSPAPPSGGNGG
ncbi:protein kinase domain-containing protein [Agromyces humatus]|uniref:non-specific serine/threonine protein kinase n=1 Tax=Agromyces humatus TaxID=279573 RepID=A0ABN2KLE1_9MICO|nr:PASTA domain-containing protein [Agromyces humatus]